MALVTRVHQIIDVMGDRMIIGFQTPTVSGGGIGPYVEISVAVTENTKRGEFSLVGDGGPMVGGLVRLAV